MEGLLFFLKCRKLIVLLSIVLESLQNAWNKRKPMGKIKVLIVTQEMEPYTLSSEIANLSRKLPQYAQEKGMEVRVLMPKFGCINERRHRLHEVVRLSGMNIIVDDDDFPLIIKVASLPDIRMQVYFLDNDDFFKGRDIFRDAGGVEYADNSDRMIFFCKGVIETVRKFGWSPDIVHCHGWMTSLVPFYLKTAYKNDPLFSKVKVIYSVFSATLEKSFDAHFFTKASINNLQEEDLQSFRSGDGVILHQGAIIYADAVIQAESGLDEGLQVAIDEVREKPLLKMEGEDLFAGIPGLYRSMISDEEK
jgi:starch synthase